MEGVIHPAPAAVGVQAAVVVAAVFPVVVAVLVAVVVAEGGNPFSIKTLHIF